MYLPGMHDSTAFDPVPPGSPKPPMADAAGNGSPIANGTANSIAGLIEGLDTRWNYGSPLGTHTTVTYSFRDVAPATYGDKTDGDPTTTFQPLPQALRETVRVLLHEFELSSGLTLQEVPDNAGPQIQIGGMDVLNGFTGYSFYPSFSGNGTLATRAGDVWIDYTQFTSGGPGGYFRNLLLHEVSHALGLKHPFDGTTGEQLPSDLDRLQYTVMTYQNYGDLTQNRTIAWDGSRLVYSWQYRETLGPLDVQALQYLYGSTEFANHGGDDRYAFDGVATMMRTLVDTGGIDTIDASTSKLRVVIDLREGMSSSIGIRTQAEYFDLLRAQGAPESVLTSARNFLSTEGDTLYTGRNNLALAAGTKIERAIGGSGDDVLIGNSLDNQLTGGAGNDRITGGDGFDTAIFAGARAGFQLLRAADGTVTVTFGGETDTLLTTEALQFDNKTVFALGGDDATVARLYGAAFGRAPDPGGLGVQLGALHAGLTVAALAGNFLGSAEFRSRYGAAPSNGDYATALYSNVLGRTPDPGGLAVQVDALEHGLSRVTLLVNFADSAENKAKVAGDWLLS